MAGPAVVALRLNGRPLRIEVDPDAQLLDVLREDLGLVGTRFGCGEEQCGACHVLVDGRVRCACTMPITGVEGREVTSVEGIAPAALAEALRDGFVAEQAMQCGFCSAGMLIGAAALIARNPDPSDAEVRAALDGNLCRCGAHNRIVRAVLRAARAVRSSV